jgi:arsenate reductase-like glutaredoxin family protein
MESNNSEIIDNINEIYNVLDKNKKHFPSSVINEVHLNVDKMCQLYDDRFDNLVHDMKIQQSQHQREASDLIKQHELKFLNEREMRNKINRIWKGKILIRQIMNDRFYEIANKNKNRLDQIPNKSLLDELLRKNIVVKRPNTITDHIGAKLAYAIICELIHVQYISIEMCNEYIYDNDLMHPEFQPLSKVIDELRTFESTIKTLDDKERITHNVNLEIVSEEIQFFIKTENNK